MSLIRNGMALPEPFLTTGRRVMTGAQMIVWFGTEVQVKALVKIHETADPMEIDYLIQSGPDDGTLQLGLMEWHGDCVRFCFAMPDAVRPSEFRAGPEDRRTLAIWRRAL